MLDSLGGNKLKGFAFIEGRIIDSTLQFTDIEIVKLNLQTINEENYIDYYYGIDSINNKFAILKAKQYLPFFVEYFNSLQIERVSGLDSQEVNVITLPIKFR